VSGYIGQNNGQQRESKAYEMENLNKAVEWLVKTTTRSEMQSIIELRSEF